MAWRACDIGWTSSVGGPVKRARCWPRIELSSSPDSNPGTTIGYPAERRSEGCRPPRSNQTPHAAPRGLARHHYHRLLAAQAEQGAVGVVRHVRSVRSDKAPGCRPWPGRETPRPPRQHGRGTRPRRWRGGVHGGVQVPDLLAAQRHSPCGRANRRLADRENRRNGQWPMGTPGLLAELGASRLVLGHTSTQHRVPPTVSLAQSPAPNRHAIVMAGALMSVVPLIAVFLLGARYLIRGFTGGRGSLG